MNATPVLLQRGREQSDYRYTTTALAIPQSKPVWRNDRWPDQEGQAVLFRLLSGGSYRRWGVFHEGRDCAIRADKRSQRTGHRECYECNILPVASSGQTPPNPCFQSSQINRAAMNLLNAKLPNGQFLIPSVRITGAQATQATHARLRCSSERAQLESQQSIRPLPASTIRSMPRIVWRQVLLPERSNH